MNEQTQELIAIGASIAGHCQPCLEHHLAKAREAGLSEADIRAAIDVGRMVERGAMNAMREFSNSVFDKPEHSSSTCCQGSSDSPGTKCCG